MEPLQYCLFTKICFEVLCNKFQTFVTFGNIQHQEINSNVAQETEESLNRQVHGLHNGRIPFISDTLSF